MAADKRENPSLEADEDWKSRVKAEDAQRDASPSRAPADSEPALPDASLLGLIQLLASQAVVALGMIPGPDGKEHVQLSVAKHFVDLLAVLEEKCKGNLSMHESKALERALHDLRLTYVEVSKNPPAKS